MDTACLMRMAELLNTSPVRYEVPSRAVDLKVGTVLIPTGQETKPAHARFSLLGAQAPTYRVSLDAPHPPF